MDPAFDALVEQVYVPLQRYLLRRTDRSTAEDVLGDTLLVLWRRRADVPDGMALPWAYGVARGCLGNARRATDRREALLRRLAAEPTAAPPVEDPDLAEALERLPDRDRELLRLWAWEQLAPREIAVVLGTTPNAVSIRLHRATRKLRDQLRKTHGPAGHTGPRQDTEAPG